MKKILLLAALLVCASMPSLADVNVDIYSGYTCCDDGAPFSGFIGEFTSPDVQFGASNSWYWTPLGQTGDFGAVVSGTLVVPADDWYAFILVSDDGSNLFIDGSLIIANGGPHGPAGYGLYTYLTAGSHPFNINYFECCGNPASGLDLNLYDDGRGYYNREQLHYGNVPEPASMALLGTGLVGISTRLRRKFHKK